MSDGKFHILLHDSLFCNKCMIIYWIFYRDCLEYAQLISMKNIILLVYTFSFILVDEWINNLHIYFWR